jgi:hypothetical protein
MLIEDAFDKGKPHSGAFELLLAVETLEYPEQFIGIPHIEPCAVIPYKISDARRALQGTDRYPRIVLFGRVFQRISDEVHPHLLEQVLVTPARGQRIDRDKKLLFGP